MRSGSPTRLRRGCFALAALSLILGLATCFVGMSYRRRPLILLVHQGAVHLWWVRDSTTSYGGDTPFAVNSGYGFAWPAQMPMLMTTSTPFVWIARVPFWLPSVGFAAASFALWRVERRRRLRQRHSRCMACGYDRSGLGSAGCPECGARDP